MKDAFYRWDGFSYYASFSEFIPSVALASILWSIVSVLTALIVWMLFKVFKWFCNLIGKEIGTEHLFFFTCVFLLSGILAWKGKKLIWSDVHTTFQIKLLVLLCISTISIFTTWKFRDKALQWSGTVIHRITPLVWLFGIFVILAIPIVAYCTLIDGFDESVSQKTASGFSVDGNRPNIILVTFDALAARNMSAYGYHKETTPFISRWSKNATLFARAEAASNFTTPAAVSLMTGKRVWTHETYHIAGSHPVRSKVESLPALLKNNGYFNIGLVVNPNASLNALGMTSSFDIAPNTSEFGTSASLFGWRFGIIDKLLYRLFDKKIRLHNWIIKNDFVFSKIINLVSRNISQTTVSPDKVFNKFVDIVDKDLQNPFFAWIHIFPPHDPYLPPEAFMEEKVSSKLRTYKAQEKVIEESYKYLFKYQGLPEEMHPAVDTMRGYYDEFITYIDREFEIFVEKLNSLQLENTIVLLTSDHGESFEHGYFTHGGPFLYEQVTHIPFIIQEAGQTKGHTVDAIVEQIDIPATILELANIPVPSWMEGRSLVPLMSGNELPREPAFSMNFEQNRSRGHQIINGSIAVWDGNYKMIHYIEKNESLLFNIKEDADELHNLIDSEPEIGQQLTNLIKNGLEMANDRIKNRK